MTKNRFLAVPHEGLSQSCRRPVRTCKGMRACTPCKRSPTLAQVVWWSVFNKRYAGEIAAQEEVFGGAGGAARLAALRLRVTEHNVLVVAKYYSLLTLARLAELLDLPAEEVTFLLFHTHPGHGVFSVLYHTRIWRKLLSLPAS